MHCMPSMNLTVDTASAVDAKIAALPRALCARLLRLQETVEYVVPQALRSPHVRLLDGKLEELWVRADGTVILGTYVAAANRRVVVLHVLAKKSRNTPGRALATARKWVRQVMTWLSCMI